MTMTPQREALARLIDEHGVDYAKLSRMLGRNPAYIQQFIKRGTPKRLDERDRARLAAFFGVSESVLGGPATAALPSELVTVPRLDVRASAGPGALGGSEATTGHIAFDRGWLRQMSSAKADDLSFIVVRGDSMSPTLVEGDDILVDQGDSAVRLRDGIYVLRKDDALLVKRLAINPSTRRVTIKSDNPSYEDWPDCDPATFDVIGRVIWAGRRVL